MGEDSPSTFNLSYKLTACCIVCAISDITPLAAVTVPLTLGGGIACGLGGGVVLGSSATQIALLKKHLEEAKRTIKEHDEKFSLMAHWFTMPEELKKTLESVVSYEILKEVGEDLKKFFAEVTHKTNMTIGDFKIRFKEVLKLGMQKLNKSGKITSEFSDVFTPIVITFIFLVCLMKGKNRIILDCIMINQSLALSLISILNLGVPAGQLANGLIRGVGEFGDDFFKLAFAKILVGVSIAIDVLNIVLTSIEIHKRPEPQETKKIKDAAEQLEQMFLAIEKVYNGTKKFENAAPGEWTTIVVNSVPDDAGQEDIKKAVKPHLPDKAWYCIKLRRLPTKGNNWFVKVPTSHSEQLLQQSHLIIKEERCIVTQ
ncbi:hypothetical protein AVEN_132419-1 [Araneus ventricosus]|uniref:Uncharacterized protein n=1 Tax=Araneus ventricosus TaxID=182803 RepID=A0A4Y2TC34_ARAVE|nr:hypothetical protein AVEN_132419-1 [Araneus ventricosus]